MQQDTEFPRTEAPTHRKLTIKPHRSPSADPLRRQQENPEGETGITSKQTQKKRNAEKARRRDLQERPLHTVLSPAGTPIPAADFPALPPRRGQPLPRGAAGRRRGPAPRRAPRPGGCGRLRGWGGVARAPLSLGWAPRGWAEPGHPGAPPGAGGEAGGGLRRLPGFVRAASPWAARRRLMREPAQLGSAASGVPPRESRSR